MTILDPFSIQPKRKIFHLIQSFFFTLSFFGIHPVGVAVQISPLVCLQLCRRQKGQPRVILMVCLPGVLLFSLEILAERMESGFHFVITIHLLLLPWVWEICFPFSTTMTGHFSQKKTIDGSLFSKAAIILTDGGPLK